MPPNTRNTARYVFSTDANSASRRAVGVSSRPTLLMEAVSSRSTRSTRSACSTPPISACVLASFPGCASIRNIRKPSPEKCFSKAAREMRTLPWNTAGAVAATSRTRIVRPWSST